MRRRSLVPLVVLLSCAASLPDKPAPQNAGTLFTHLYTAYVGGDWDVIERTPRPQVIPVPEIKAAVARWRKDWRPLNAVFLLEMSWRWSSWLSEDARALVMDRPAPLGQDARADAFELAWHKTLMSYLEGQRHPEFIDTSEVAALSLRITAARSAPVDPRIVDPWVELTLGIIDEQRTLGVPSSLARFGLSAIEHFDRAAAFEVTRPEAMVRKAALLVRLSRPKEALNALEGLAEDDQTLRYWSQIFRGRALEALGRPDDAVRAYTDALETVPHAQSPAVALTSLEMRRGRAAEAQRWASVGWAPGNAVDPWWQYDAGEYRFFRARLAVLRAFIKP